MNFFMELIIFLGIVFGVIAIICFLFMKWFKAGVDKIKREIEAVNHENNTNFTIKRNIGSRIFIDTDNRKLYFIQATGMAGVKNYNVLQRWSLEHTPSNTHKARLTIYINDIDKPLMIIPYMTYDVAQRDAAKLNAVFHQ